MAAGKGFTPLLGRVRDMYTWATRWEAVVRPDRPDLAQLQVTQRAEFDAAIAEHDAELLAQHAPRIAAEALREAARQMQVGIGDPWNPAEDVTLRRHWSARRAYLFARADKLDPPAATFEDRFAEAIRRDQETGALPKPTTETPIHTNGSGA